MELIVDDLRSLESFLHSVEAGSFSAAASILGVTPAAVSKQVAGLEKSLGTRLFQRTTRHLALTEAGERLYAETALTVRSLRQSMVALTERAAAPAGTLKLSVAPGFGRQYILPLMPAFLERYPDIQLDWNFENRHVDLVKDGFDAAIGAGIAPDANVVARQLMPIRLLTVASPSYLAAHGTPMDIDDLSRHECIRLRSATTGRLWGWSFPVENEMITVPVDGRMIFTDLDAVCEAALAGMGLARLGVHHVLPHLESGRLVPVLPQSVAVAGTICVYYAHYRLTPPKVRAFVEYLDAHFRGDGLSARMAGYAG